jgi:stearoyl-CoA desaturase (delta-9 desaturase)
MNDAVRTYRQALSSVQTSDREFNLETFLILAHAHAIALYTVVFHFSWTAFLWTWLAAALMSCGVSVGYHRLFAHRAFKTTTFLRRVFATIGVLGVNDRPAQWVAHHRIHHAYTDTPRDLHSPSVFGFFFAHVAWFYRPPAAIHKYENFSAIARDVLADPYIDWLSRTRYPSYLLTAILGAILYAIGGFDWFLWGVYVRVVMTWQGFFCVNSVTHKFGYRNYAVRNTSTNCPLIDVIVLGEGLHNNHHAQASSAKFSHKWFEFDFWWGLIWVLERAGLAWDVKRPNAVADEVEPTVLPEAG